MRRAGLVRDLEPQAEIVAQKDRRAQFTHVSQSSRRPSRSAVTSTETGVIRHCRRGVRSRSRSFLFILSPPAGLAAIVSLGRFQAPRKTNRPVGGRCRPRDARRGSEIRAPSWKRHSIVGLMRGEIRTKLEGRTELAPLRLCLVRSSRGRLASTVVAPGDRL